MTSLVREQKKVDTIGSRVITVVKFYTRVAKPYPVGELQGARKDAVASLVKVQRKEIRRLFTRNKVNKLAKNCAELLEICIRSLQV